MQGATNAQRDEPERLMAATHPPSGTRDQDAPPSRVVTRTPPLLTQPTRAGGNTIVGAASGEKSLIGAGNLPPMTLHVLPPFPVCASRAPHLEPCDHTPSPVVALRNVIADSEVGAMDVPLQAGRLTVTTRVVVVTGAVVTVVVEAPVDDVGECDASAAELEQAANITVMVTITPTLRTMLIVSSIVLNRDSGCSVRSTAQLT